MKREKTPRRKRRMKEEVKIREEEVNKREEEEIVSSHSEIEGIDSDSLQTLKEEKRKGNSKSKTRN